jgi:hypothetical protein
MGLDVRLPIGLLFFAIGLALVTYGLTSDPAIYAKSLGKNVNLWWGLVLLAFGATMFYFGWSARPALKEGGTPPVSPKRPESAKARREHVAR